jgi:aldose 1-epimerase
MPFGEDRSAGAPICGELTLRVGNDTVAVAPHKGGVLTHWTVAGRAILYARGPVHTDPLQSACFPLVPYSNLIAGGGFWFDRRFYPLARNHPREPEPIHGDAWLAPWEIVQRLRDCLILAYQHDGSTGFPFRYRVLQRISLAPGRLTIVLRLSNTDSGAMPAGLGLHPYFRKPPATRLQALHGGRWVDGRLIPDEQFCSAEELGHDTIDTCFVHWNRRASLHWPAERVCISLEASASACALVVYSPRDSDFLCIEPVTNVNDGFNAAANNIANTGVKTLRPGDNLELSVTLTVHAPSEIMPAAHLSASD